MVSTPFLDRTSGKDGRSNLADESVNPESETVSLFVVHWNQPSECTNTVNSLLDQKIPLEITVIDNDSKPEAFQLLKSKLTPAVEIVRLNENKGWGGALNVVLKRWLQENRNQYCLISAHDAMPEPDCLRLLIASANADAQVAIACPQYHDRFIARFSGSRGVYPEFVDASPTGTAQLVDVPHGTLMLLRRACLEQIGLFDERYFAYGDEHELGARAVRHGWKVVMVWGAIVTNPGTWTESPLRSYLFARNSLLLVRDYRGKFSAALRALLILLNTFRLAIRSPNKAFAFSSRARFFAVRDYFLGRWGRPNFAG
jgi:N-acetylglucosaminyl-diphospho-decaprenol L-rhamnosyltransferase